MLPKVKYKFDTAFQDLYSYSRAQLKQNGVSAFWFRGIRNFGDLLTKELFESFGRTAIYAQPERASIIGVGSLIHILSRDFSGEILGSGCIDNKKYCLPDATFTLVRGEKTIDGTGISSQTPIGDPGILASNLVKTLSKKKFEIGLVPHYADKFHPWVQKALKEGGNSITLIDVQNTATAVAKQISECSLIISSSLHGIIVADSFKIPNIWVTLSDKVIGNGFKFHDYNTALDFEQETVIIKEGHTLNFVATMANLKNENKIDAKKIELNGIFASRLIQGAGAV